MLKTNILQVVLPNVWIIEIFSRKINSLYWSAGFSLEKPVLKLNL